MRTCARVSLAALLILTLACTAIAQSEDQGYGVTYRSGHAGYTKKFNGRLVITDTHLQFDKQEPRFYRKAKFEPVFTIPLASIVNVVEDFGFRTFLILKTETPEKAEAITIQVFGDAAQEVSTKISFAARKAREQAGLK